MTPRRSSRERLRRVVCSTWKYGKSSVPIACAAAAAAAAALSADTRRPSMRSNYVCL
jgi:hypothetical protein